MTATIDSILVVRRSIHIAAAPARVWQEFESFDRMNAWWGIIIGTPTGGEATGQRLIRFEPRVGGRIEMEVNIDGAPARYGGDITVFNPAQELTFENDWIPNQGWLRPTLITIRLTGALGGTLVELMHHGFERTGADGRTDHAGYEGGWGMTQLNALRDIVESA
jgi:uncharacterized protein YndB with AHSA1/START domain